MSLSPLTSSHFRLLDRIDFQLLERFERAGIKTLTDLALFSPLELSLKFRLSINYAEEILQRLFSTLGVQSKTAYEMLIDTTTSSSYLPTKLPSLNRYLNGGLRRGSLVELCGSWGSGKTQFCLHLTAECCLMGYRSIYIDTEHTFSSYRLLDMIGDRTEKPKELLELVQIQIIHDPESLLNFMNEIEKQIEEDERNKQNKDQHPVLLIVDSIAAPLRMSNANFSREKTLLVFTDCAKRLATRYNLLVLVTNQVTTKRRSNVLTEKNDDKKDDEFYMSVALGKSWSYSVNVRLAISYQGDTLRQLIVGKSIESPNYSVSFRILSHGIEENEDLFATNTQRRRSERRARTTLIQADEIQLVGKQIRP